MAKMLYTQDMYNAEVKAAIKLYPRFLQPVVRVIVAFAGINDEFPIEIDERELKV